MGARGGRGGAGWEDSREKVPGPLRSRARPATLGHTTGHHCMLAGRSGMRPTALAGAEGYLLHSVRKLFDLFLIRLLTLVGLENNRWRSVGGRTSGTRDDGDYSQH